MPTTIPYDPSLSLTNIVPPEKLETLLEIGKKQAEISAAEESFANSLLTLRSLKLTLTEMENLNVPVNDLQQSVTDAAQNLQEVAKTVISVKLKNSTAIGTLKSKLNTLGKSYESPVDYVRTVIKAIPIAADSLSLDAQYFSHDEEKQGASNSISEISAFITGSTSFLGDKYAAETADAARKAVSSQIENHQIEGTLIITCSCTHKEAAILAPFHIDVDKAIIVWNQMFPEKMIKMDSVKNIKEIADEANTDDEQKMNILSGTVNGSSFVGMVHVLKESDTKASQRMLSLAASLRANMEVGTWFESMSGGLGVNTGIANDVKKMLSAQDISSHVSLICVGAIPSIASNEVQIGVKQFADFDAAKMMQQLAALQNATNAAQSSVSSEAANARAGKMMTAIKAEEVKGVMAGLEAVDDGKNKILDINSMMTAFEDYVNKATQGKCGVPIQFYIKPITRSEIAKLWVQKYFPGQYITDDSENPGGNAGSGGGVTGGGGPP